MLLEAGGHRSRTDFRSATVTVSWWHSSSRSSPSEQHARPFVRACVRASRGQHRSSHLDADLDVVRVSCEGGNLRDVDRMGGQWPVSQRANLIYIEGGAIGGIDIDGARYGKAKARRRQRGDRGQRIRKQSEESEARSTVPVAVV